MESDLIMTTIAELLEAKTSDPEKLINYLRNDLLPKATALMNNKVLPKYVPLFPEDRLPTNQRNLTDSRTRIGVLLEYEFAKAVNEVLEPVICQEEPVLTYVVANQFPDLAFRSSEGRLGVRFEMKAIQTIAEEKSANFSTLIKDIRNGADFVVVLLWEWQPHQTKDLKFPFICDFSVMDAYQLATIRDCYWLNSPPIGLESARQGFDLTFGVNAREDSFNKEEGNYGKLMRIFDSKYEQYLPNDVRESETLKAYYQFRKDAICLGLQHVVADIAQEAAEGNSGSSQLVSNALPVKFVVTRNSAHLTIIGFQSLVGVKQRTLEIMREYQAGVALILNEKFSWQVRDASWNRIDGGSKPAEAENWVRRTWETIHPPNLV